MPGEPGKKRARAFLAEARFCKPRRRPKRVQAEACEEDRVLWNAEWAERIGEEGVWVREDGFDHCAVRRSVAPKAFAGALEVAPQHDGGAVIERVCDGSARLYPLESVLFERKGAEEGRKDSERVHGGTDVVLEAGKGEFGCARAAADFVGGLEDADRRAFACESDGSGQAWKITAVPWACTRQRVSPSASTSVMTRAEP